MDPAAPPDPAETRPAGARHTQGWRRLLIEPRRPESIRNSPKAPWLVVTAVCFGAFMGQLDASIVTVAFPTLRHAFGASLASVQWVGQAYLLVLIGLLTAVGRYADMVGRKLLYTYGFVVFIIGSAACGLAPSLGILIVFRVVQGIGAAMLQANSVAIIASAAPKDQLGRAIGVQGAAQALGLALGPAVGGLLISAGGWRLIFFVNVPVGIAATVLAWLLIPRSRDLAARAAYDWPGLAIFVPAITAIILAISFGDKQGWSSPEIVVGLTVGAVLLTAFTAREHKTQHPMLDLDLLARPAFSAGITTGLLSYLVLFGTLTVAPFLLEIGHHQGTGAAGAEMFLLPLGVGIAAPIAGRMSDHTGPRPLTTGGMVIAAAALAITAAFDDNLVAVLVLLAVCGIGIGMFTPPNNAAIMGAAPRHQSGMASGVLNMTRGLGTSLGLALAGLAYTAGAGAHAHPSTTQASAGYTDAAWFLAAIALAAAAIAAVRGQTALNTDPTLMTD